METEWLGLWCHYVWSGMLCMFFCLFTWWKLRTMANTKAGNQQRRVLLRVAAVVSLCLFLNVVATLSMSHNLDEWSQTTDLALTCELKETWSTRNLTAYGFNEGDLGKTKVCDEKETVDVVNPCQSDCYWYPSITTEGLTCQDKYFEFSSWEANIEYKLSLEAQGLTSHPRSVPPFHPPSKKIRPLPAAADVENLPPSPPPSSLPSY